MICHNCRVPIDWDGVSPIVICEFCRSYRFVDVPDETAEQIVSLNRPGELCCPRCRRRLTAAAMDGLKVEHCGECSGVLLDSEVFAMFVRNRREQFRDAAQQPVVLLTEQLKRDVNCPFCRKAMSVHPCYGPNYIIVDACVDCGIVWLDCREMVIAEPTPSVFPAHGRPVP